MRITHVCRVGWPHVGGMETVVGLLARAQHRHGHDVDVITLDRAVTDGSELVEGIFSGVHYRRLPRLGPRRYPFARGLVPAVRGADVVHVHGLDGLVEQLVRDRRHGARVGVSTHGAFLHRRRNALKQLALVHVRRTLGRADAVWFTSASDRAAIGLQGPVLGDCVDVAFFARTDRTPVPGRVLIFGRVDVHKGIDDAIEVLGALGRIDEPVVLEVVGPDRHGLRDRLERLARAHRVELVWTGPVDDVRDALARAELCLFPSRYEGFGVAVVEAMAAGVPVVVSAIPAFDELVQHGVDGFQVDFRQPARAARALAAIRGRTDTAGPARASAARWDAAVRSRLYEQAYADLGRTS